MGDDRTQFISFALAPRPFVFTFQVLFSIFLFSHFRSMCWRVRCDSRWIEWNGIIRIVFIAFTNIRNKYRQLNEIRWTESSEGEREKAKQNRPMSLIGRHSSECVCFWTARQMYLNSWIAIIIIFYQLNCTEIVHRSSRHMGAVYVARANVIRMGAFVWLHFGAGMEILFPINCFCTKWIRPPNACVLFLKIITKVVDVTLSLCHSILVCAQRARFWYAIRIRRLWSIKWMCLNYKCVWLLCGLMPSCLIDYNYITTNCIRVCVMQSSMSKLKSFTYPSVLTTIYKLLPIHCIQITVLRR